MRVCVHAWMLLFVHSCVCVCVIAHYNTHFNRMFGGLDPTVTLSGESTGDFDLHEEPC